MAKQDIFNAIDNAVAQGKGIEFNTTNIPPDLTIQELADKIKQVSGKDVLDELTKAYAKKQRVSLPFNKLQAKDAYNRPIQRQEQIREAYPSERYFGPITSGITQAAAGLGLASRRTPVGIAGAGIVGGGLELGRQITQALGSEPGTPKTSGEALGRVGMAAGQAAGLEGLTRGVFKGAGQLYKPAELRPAQVAIMEIADKYKVPLSVADIKQTKLSSFLESISEKSLVSGNIIQEFRGKQLKAFTNVVDDLVSKSGGKIDRETAGNIAKESFDKLASAAKTKTDELYAAARSSLSDAERKNVNNTAIKQMARNMLEKEKMVAKNIQSPIVPLLNDISKKESIYDNVDAAMQLQSKLKEFIRDEALKAGKMGVGQRTTPLGMKFTQLLTASEKDMAEYFKTANPGAKGLFDIARASAKSEKMLYGNKDVLNLVSKSPEKIVDAVVKTNNVTAIRNIKRAVGEDGFKPIKQRFLQDLVESTKTNEFGGVDAYRPSAMANILNKYEPETLRAMFTKSELTELTEISKLGSVLQTAEKIAGNPSGTGQIVSGSLFLSQIFTNPVVTATGIGIPLILSKTMTSPIGRKIMIDGLKAKPGTAEMAKAVTRFINFAALSKITQPNKNAQK